MAFIVSLYKYLIIIGCFVIIAGLAFLVFASADLERATGQQITATTIGFAVFAGLLLIIVLFGTAVLISIHDRHREVAEGIDRIASVLERQRGGE